MIVSSIQCFITLRGRDSVAVSSMPPQRAAIEIIAMHLNIVFAWVSSHSRSRKLLLLTSSAGCHFADDDIHIVTIVVF
jgi:hypothetical protein